MSDSDYEDYLNRFRTFILELKEDVMSCHTWKDAEALWDWPVRKGYTELISPSVLSPTAKGYGVVSLPVVHSAFPERNLGYPYVIPLEREKRNPFAFRPMNSFHPDYGLCPSVTDMDLKLQCGVKNVSVSSRVKPDDLRMLLHYVKSSLDDIAKALRLTNAGFGKLSIGFISTNRRTSDFGCRYDPETCTIIVPGLTSAGSFCFAWMRFYLDMVLSARISLGKLRDLMYWSNARDMKISVFTEHAEKDLMSCFDADFKTVSFDGYSALQNLIADIVKKLGTGEDFSSMADEVLNTAAAFGIRQKRGGYESFLNRLRQEDLALASNRKDTVYARYGFGSRDELTMFFRIFDNISKKWLGRDSIQYGLLFSRAGAVWLKEKLDSAGIHNDFLCGGAEPDSVQDVLGHDLYLYPVKEEWPRISGEFDVILSLFRSSVIC